MWIEPHNGMFRIRDRRNGKVVTVRSGIETKTAAKQLLTTYSADKLRGEFIDPRAGKVLIKDWVEQWWSSHVNTIKISARRQETGRIKNHIVPHIGDIQLGDYDNGTDAWWVSEMQADGLGPKSIRNVHGLLFQAMKAAVAQQKIRANPCKGTRMPELIRHEMRFLLEPEADQLIAALPEHWRPAFITLLGTGMRWAELAGLRVSRVDVLGGTVRVEETLQEVEGQLLSVPPKTKTSRRTISLPMQVREALVPLTVNRKRSDYLFLEPSGEPMRHKHVFKYVWMPARKRAELEDLRIHDLRHTHASWLIADGVQLTAIQRRLGHSSISITSDIYGHLLPDVDTALVGKLEKRMSLISAGGANGEQRPGNQPELAGAQRR